MESFPTARELRVVSDREVQPTHENRRARGGLMRPIGSLRMQVSRPWSPAAGSSAFTSFVPSTRAILARLSAIRDESSSAVVPSVRTRITGLERLADIAAPHHGKTLLPAPA